MLYRLQISLTNYEVLRKIIALDSSRQYVLHKENVTHTTVCQTPSLFTRAEVIQKLQPTPV